ncbi:hypothetical protein ACIGXF_36640 [Streptomyces sp. NPDC053086]|uniref:hypothetical protein n=1 Tax=unclassified Streptomyces TaxID=2593676 RepID=UPI0037CDD600
MQPDHDRYGVAELHDVGGVAVDVLGQGAQEVVSLCGVSPEGWSGLLDVEVGEYADVEFVVLGVVADQVSSVSAAAESAVRAASSSVWAAGRGSSGMAACSRSTRASRSLTVWGRRGGSCWVAARTMVCHGPGGGSSGRLVSGGLPVRAQVTTLPML